MYQELRRASFTDPKGSPFPSCPQPEALLTPVLQLIAQHMDWAEASEALANTVRWEAADMAVGRVLVVSSSRRRGWKKGKTRRRRRHAQKLTAMDVTVGDAAL